MSNDIKYPKQDYNRVCTEVVLEIMAARKRFPNMRGPHEAYAVILEELDEFWDSVKSNRPSRKELIQVAAMAIASIVELNSDFCAAI